MERNKRYSQVEELSDPVSEGRRRSDTHIYSPTTHSRHPRTPSAPAPSEDRLFPDWSSVEPGSPLVVPPTQSVPIEGTLITPGTEDIHEAEQAALESSQPISQGSHIDTTSHAVQEDFPSTQNVLAASRKINCT